jgi:hypothetical protein
MISFAARPRAAGPGAGPAGINPRRTEIISHVPALQCGADDHPQCHLRSVIRPRSETPGGAHYRLAPTSQHPVRPRLNRPIRWKSSWSPGSGGCDRQATEMISSSLSHSLIRLRSDASVDIGGGRDGAGWDSADSARTAVGRSRKRVSARCRPMSGEGTTVSVDSLGGRSPAIRQSRRVG